MAIVEGLPSSFMNNGVVCQIPNMRICDYRRFGERQQIMTITNRNITQICAAIEPVDQDLMSIAETIFASPAIWNASFLLENGKHVPSTWKNMGVDLHEASNKNNQIELLFRYLFFTNNLYYIG